MKEKTIFDVKSREGIPRVERFKQYGINAYCIVGTKYGFLHNVSGDIAVYKSRSQANIGLKKYIENNSNP